MKKARFIIIFSWLILLSACSTIDVGVTANQKELKSLKKIAIFPMEVASEDINKEFTDSLALHLLKTGRIEILERDRKYINKILQEQNFARSGLIDQETAAKMGKFLGVDAIVLGRAKLKKIAPRTNSNKKTERANSTEIIDTFSLKLINVESGTIVVNLRKASGIEWNWLLVLKKIFGFGVIWSSHDLLKQSSQIDYLSGRAVEKMDVGMAQVLKKAEK